MRLSLHKDPKILRAYCPVRNIQLREEAVQSFIERVNQSGFIADVPARMIVKIVLSVFEDMNDNSGLIFHWGDGECRIIYDVHTMCDNPASRITKGDLRTLSQETMFQILTLGLCWKYRAARKVKRGRSVYTRYPRLLNVCRNEMMKYKDYNNLFEYRPHK